MISSQSKVHSQPKWVVAVPSGRRTSFVRSDVHNPSGIHNFQRRSQRQERRTSRHRPAVTLPRVQQDTRGRSIDSQSLRFWNALLSVRQCCLKTGRGARCTCTTLIATSSLSRYWVMLVLAVVTTQRQRNQDGRNTVPPDRTERLSVTAFVLGNLQSIRVDFGDNSLNVSC